MFKNINQICQSILIFFPKFMGKISVWFLFLMILLTTFVVIARYLFGIGILSLQELIIYAHGITILLLSFDYVSFSWEIKEVSAEPGGLPFVYLYKSTILIFSILLLMQSFANILSYFSDD